jgi:hypothetical protein
VGTATTDHPIAETEEGSASFRRVKSAAVDPLQTFGPAHQIKTIPQLQVRLIAIKTRKKRVDFMVWLNFCFNRAEDTQPKRLV